jgi:Leucine-rich repeat (LRR) protein
MSKPKEARLKGLQMLPLSKAIDGHNDDGKVSLVQRSISKIDQVNAKHHAITTLYLSGNFITTLDNIGQFPQLKVLSLASNNIESVQTLRLLSQLPHL